MCDGYSQSTQHARVVAWLERGPLMAWLADDANVSGSGDAEPVATRTRSAQEQAARLRARTDQASAPSLSVEQSPASQ